MALAVLMCCYGATEMKAAETETQNGYQLEVPEMKPELVAAPTLTFESAATPEPNLERAWKPDFDFFKSKTNKGVKPYKFMDDMTFAGVPLFLAGIAVKGDKAMFRVNNKEGKKNTQLLTNFKTGIDD